ncbi:MAG: ABC transporter ATP-binding protein [Ruminococcaceae bacterium]|nr:ABC transporter ATP-binding protein [Oscillospiraceae bacterium]
MLACHNVSAGYDGAEVLHKVSFELPAGKNLAVLGPNGAGKSTLLKCIAGLLPFTGRIAAAGLRLPGAKRAELARQVAILSQQAGAVFPYTVREVVMMGRYVHLKRGLLRGYTQEDHVAAEEALAAAGIIELAQRPVTQLSGGQLQRVFLAQVLAQQPQLILLDEPTSHLDLRVQAELLGYLERWSAQPGRAVVGVLHDINQALELADMVLLLRDGAVLAYGPAADVVRPALLEATYGIDVAARMLASLEMWQAIAGRT